PAPRRAWPMRAEPGNDGRSKRAPPGRGANGAAPWTQETLPWAGLAVQTGREVAILSVDPARAIGRLAARRVKMSVFGRPGGRNVLIFTDVIELWTWLLVVLLSAAAVIALPALLMEWPLAAALAVPCFILLHVLLLWRVLLRRRWACMLSSLYGWVF